MIDKNLIRINRFIANAGVCSRREADNLISQGKITVNQKVVNVLGTKINPDKDTVRYNGKILASERKVYVILNKPKGYVSAVSDSRHRTIMELINAREIIERLYPVGRLDKYTTGLIILTNDGALTKKLSHPSSQIQKKYIVRLQTPITEKELEQLQAGLSLEDGISTFDSIEILNSQQLGDTLLLELHSGKNRIIRRTFEALGKKIISLDRNNYAGLTKKGIPRGKWKYLNQKEIGFLKTISKSHEHKP